MPEPTEAISDNQLATVVIPVRDEESFIAACLKSVLAQTYKQLQIIVVDGDSRDRTVPIVRSYMAADPRVELIDNPDQIVPTALNMAARSARGRYFIRVDAHSTIEPDYIAKAVGLLRDGTWGGVGGRKDGVGVTDAGRAIARAMASRFGVGNSLYHYGSSAQSVEHIPIGAYETEVVRELDGWNESLPVNGDFEFDHRIIKSGRKLLFDPSLRIDWHCRQSIKELLRQYRRYGMGKSMVVRLHPDSIRLRHFAAPALVLGIGAAAFLAPFRPRRALAILTPYAVALGVASCHVARQVEGVRAKLNVPAAFLAMHLGWGIGFWEGVLAQLRGATPRPAPTSAVGSV